MNEALTLKAIDKIIEAIETGRVGAGLAMLFEIKDLIETGIPGLATQHAFLREHGIRDIQRAEVAKLRG